jgi:hypothetical protein
MAKRGGMEGFPCPEFSTFCGKGCGKYLNKNVEYHLVITAQVDILRG